MSSTDRRGSQLTPTVCVVLQLAVKEQMRDVFNVADPTTAVEQDLATGLVLAPSDRVEYLDLIGREFVYTAGFSENPRDGGRLMLTGVTNCSPGKLELKRRHGLTFEYRATVGSRSTAPVRALWDQAIAHARNTSILSSERPLERWQRIFWERRKLLERLADPIQFTAIERDREPARQRDALIITAEPREARRATLGSYRQIEVGGGRKVTGRVENVEAGTIEMDIIEGDPGLAVEYCTSGGKSRRELVFDTDRNPAILSAEENAFKDAINGRSALFNLKDLIVVPNLAHFDERGDFTPAQKSLDTNQYDCVAAALAARYMMIVKGPPGTGKTFFLAELCLQQLRAWPGSKILIASQTNQAVDNALTRIHRQSPKCRIVRVGRQEKIADELQPYRLGERPPWAKEMTARAERYARFITAQKAAGDINPDHANALLAIQDEWLRGLGSSKATDTIMHAEIVAGTCAGIALESTVRKQDYDLVILEEAAKASASETLMVLNRGTKLVLVGDEDQLPPVLDPAFADAIRAREIDVTEAEATETIFPYLIARADDDHVTVLTRQYRMLPGIGRLVGDCFYQHIGGLVHARGQPDAAERDLGTVQNPAVSAYTQGAHVVWLNVRGDTRHEKKGSAYNEAEVTVTKRALLELNEAAKENGDRVKVAVITGYSAQLKRLERVVDVLNGRRAISCLNVRLGTVIRFQGDEEEVVIVSLAQTTAPGFMKMPNLINVAMSRAQDALLIVGSLEASRDQHHPKHAPGSLPMNQVAAWIDARIAEGDPQISVRGQTKGTR